MYWFYNYVHFFLFLKTRLFLVEKVIRFSTLKLVSNSKFNLVDTLGVKSKKCQVFYKIIEDETGIFQNTFILFFWFN